MFISEYTGPKRGAVSLRSGKPRLDCKTRDCATGCKPRNSSWHCIPSLHPGLFGNWAGTVVPRGKLETEKGHSIKGNGPENDSNTNTIIMVLPGRERVFQLT